MTPEPEMKPLPQGHRKFVFLMALLVFLVSVPVFVFYAVGYRIDLSGDNHSIRSVGGMYVSSSADNTEIYVDDEPVKDMRMFQRAAYIQNLSEGIHQIHVQGEGVQTWVKELPVFSHFVTEASSFNMPQVPQVRMIPEYWTSEGALVLFEQASSTPLQYASSTQPLYVASNTTATSTFVSNPEFAYVSTLFASTTEVLRALEAQRALHARPFLFSNELENATTTIATTTKEFHDTRLYEEDGEVYIHWLGDADAVPYYYCVRYGSPTTTAAFYGTHVQRGVVQQVLAAFSQDDIPMTETELRGSRWCRDTIRIDRKWQQVTWFDYFPNSRDLILMHLEDGLYVVEVDDRAWQNTQLLYPGNKIEVARDGDRIFIHDGEYYFEVFTALQK